MVNKKLIVIIIVSLLLLGAVVFLILRLSSEKEVLEEQKFTSDKPKEGNDSSANIIYASSIEQIIPKGVVSPVPNETEDKILYIDQETSGIYSFDPVLRVKEKIGSPHPGNITEASWSPNKSRVILKYENHSIVYDLKTSAEFPLHKNVQNVVFGKNNDEIFYQFAESRGKTSINKADYTGLNWKNLVDYPLENVKLGYMPSSDMIYFCPPGSAFQKTSCYKLTRSGQDLSVITQEEYGQNIKYSPEGTKILYTNTTKKGMELNLNMMDADGSNRKYLQTNTLVEKCVFGKENGVYCAVPEFIPTGSVMPDDYYSHKFVTDDIFWKIDPEKGSKTRLTEIKDFKWGNNDAASLFFLNNSRNLYFVSENGLYVLHLENL